MGSPRLIVPVVFVFMLLPRVARAQEADVERAVAATLAAWSEGRFDDFGSFYEPDARGFFLDGSPLVEGFDMDALRAAHESGFRARFTMSELDVKVYGHAAVSVAYLEGLLTLPGGAQLPGRWRYSETRVDRGGTWKVVQYHFSPLTAQEGR